MRSTFPSVASVFFAKIRLSRNIYATIRLVTASAIVSLMVQNLQRSVQDLGSDSAASQVVAFYTAQTSTVRLSEVPRPIDLEYCTENNFVSVQKEPMVKRTINNTRQYSIRLEDFQRHHSKTCESVEELLGAIKYGYRRWDPVIEAQNLTLQERENIPSVFVPSGCDIPIYAPDQICKIFNHFSHIVLQGDSLLRHGQVGILMALSNNLRNGSLVGENKQGVSCECDNQSSEHKMCRQYPKKFFEYRPHEIGLCPNLNQGPDDEPFFVVYNPNNIRKPVYKFPPSINCTDPASKSILVISQGGVHYRYNEQKTYRSYIRKFFEDPVIQTCAQERKAMFVFLGYSAQSAISDGPFPHQSANIGLPFDIKMRELIQKDKYNNLVMVEWYNFTAGAMYTDGLHFATNVNYFRAQYLVALLDLMWKEETFVSSPLT
jgi:hypothetical protein